ncbi:hypothetical protein L3Q82_012063 [Scortum barcoo]|uniref:Uncharacterized protein n=1 Tax=Scortum barcoo TaxID=214431 RepID=A0ACB8W7Q4_9TELE|nr:hypothetical protein L3Q82_012063 [Scortum barcoo]
MPAGQASRSPDGPGGKNFGSGRSSGDRRVCSNYRGSHFSASPGRSTPGYWRRRIRPIASQTLGFRRNNVGFRPGRGTLDQLYIPSTGCLRVYGVCPTSPHVLCGSGEGIRPCPSWYSVGEVLHAVWGPGAFAKGLFGLCADRSRSLVRIAGSKSDLFPVHVGLRQGCPLSPVLFIIFMDRISRRSQGPEGVRFGNHRISSLLFADDVVLMASSGQDLQHVLERFAAECEAAGMRISTSKSEAMVLDREKGGMPSPGGWRRSCLKWRSSSISGSCSRVRERWSVRLTGGLVQRPCSYARSVYRTVVVKKELSRKAKLSIYRSIYVPFPPSPMVMNFG